MSYRPKKQINLLTQHYYVLITYFLYIFQKSHPTRTLNTKPHGYQGHYNHFIAPSVSSLGWNLL